MIEKLGEILKFRLKAIAIGMFALGIGLVCYKFMSAYFDRNQQTWETNLNVDVAELLVMADQRVDKARLAVDWDCGAFTLSGKDEGAGCADARKELAAATAQKSEIEAKRSTTLSQAGQTKKYYDGVLQSSRQKPLPFYAFVGMALMAIAAVLYFLLPNIQKSLNKEGTCSADGLR